MLKLGTTTINIPHSKAYLGSDLVYEKNVEPPYTELEYIQSTGTQYIDTGFKPNNNSKVEINMYYKKGTSSNVGMFLYGARNEGAVAMFGCYIDASTDLSHGDRVEARYGTQNASRLSISNASRHYFIQDKNKFIIDNSTTQTLNTATFQTNYNMTIFAMNTGGTVGTYTLNGNRLYYMRIYDNGNLVRDFIPVLDSNNVPCLYDKVTKSFFYNAGTGTFNYGTLS